MGPFNYIAFKPFLFLTGFIFHFSFSIAQETFPVNGVHEKANNYYAFTNATVFTDYQTKIENATLLIQDGRVVKTGTDVKIPKGAVIYDLKGKHIYPSLVDIDSDYGMPPVKKTARKWGSKPQMLSNKKGAFGWNQAIKPETKAADQFMPDKKKAEGLRKKGFGTVLTHQHDGIARGVSALVTLADQKENEVLLNGNIAIHYSFQKGSSTQNYPSSLMGSIALLRQTYYDAQWYKNTNAKEERNISLEAFNKRQDLPQIFEVKDYLSAIRADKVGDEFGVQYIIKGAGDSYKRILEIKKTNAKFILPLNFPKPYEVNDPYDAMLVSIEQMKHWELAPANPAFFQKEGIDFALTGRGIENQKDFWKSIRKAIKHGLSETQALKSLTYTPAEIMGVQNEVGSLKEGMHANFIITSKNLFDEKNTIYENWVQGKRYIISDYTKPDIRGEYDLKIISNIYKLEVEGEKSKPKGKIILNDTVKKDVKILVDDKLIALSFELDDENYKGTISLSGKINYKSGIWDGNGRTPNGDWVAWSVVKKEFFKEKEKKDTSKTDSLVLGNIWYPNMAYGFTEFPKEEYLLLKNATVWTNEKAGILKSASVLIQNGKIVQIGTDLEAPEGAKTIDAKGKHITAGIIDEHSHIAIGRGVNEGSQASSAEVRIGDVTNSDDVNIYRQLAGGVTAAQSLHGSANPIGGQSGLIKLRWGLSPDEMHIKGTTGRIKFALGENVKQSNWGANNTIRFPQTRMGVEQVFYDHFIRAKEYDVEWKRYNSLSKKEKAKTTSPRKDIELEVLAEILRSERLISCHSYMQHEINMLMHVADSMGFKVNTFTHILEGYKVADKMAKHGAAGSTFSDWWAYKFEVNDAIPYNGALMHEQGVITAFNSDDAEMARRLNQEAAKAVKYGGVSEEEALKFVTLNPAKMLKLDDRMGSIKVGKDADLVIWSDNPLSIYAKAEKTFVDGICYFDIERDKELREIINKERARLVEKMLKAIKAGEQPQKPKKKDEKPPHCDTMYDYGK